MKKFLFLFLLAGIAFSAAAGDKDSTIYYPLPDSVKAVSLFAEINIAGGKDKNRFYAGISTDAVSLYLDEYKGHNHISFVSHGAGEIMVTGNDVITGKGGFGYSFKERRTSYKLLIAMAGDSAGNFSLYSGYVYFPDLDKWKLIGTFKIAGQWSFIKDTKARLSLHKKNTAIPSYSQVWCQRSNGSWKNMLEGENKPPLINLFGNVDSVLQMQKEIKLIENAIAAGTTDVKENVENVYYKMIQEGTGAPVTINDTVTVHYKGYLFADGLVFDQSKEKPATFPLKRLIRGWQIGIPLCRVGGKIKLVIPSALAYSVRTRAAKIPPNSILVFEIEVLDTKPGK